MHIGLWKMVSGLAAALAPRSGEGDAKHGNQIIALFALYVSPMAFENEAKLDRGGIEWEFFARRHFTDGGRERIFNLRAKTRCRFAADAATSSCVHNR
jgi:hypothetical protein